MSSVASQSSCFFLCSREQIRLVENRLKSNIRIWAQDNHKHKACKPYSELWSLMWNYFLAVFYISQFNLVASISSEWCLVLVDATLSVSTPRKLKSCLTTVGIEPGTFVRLIEHWTSKPLVAGSIPNAPSSIFLAFPEWTAHSELHQQKDQTSEWTIPLLDKLSN